MTAYDFEYAWKKTLCPSFKTPFAHLFYPIKNAREAKEGKTSLDQIGIYALNDNTLQVVLEKPTPHFLPLTATPHYFPIHRFIDLQYPQWPYQSQKNYPCNGPFQLKINQPLGYQLTKNTSYWNCEAISLDHIVLAQMNATQAFHAFQNKEIDWIGEPFGKWDPLYNKIKEERIVFNRLNEGNPISYHALLNSNFHETLKDFRLIS